MESGKGNGIIDAIDYRLQTIAREADAHASKYIPGTTQITIRIDNDLKAQLDVVARFLMTTRNSLINEFLQVSVDEALPRIENNPYVRDLTISGKSIREAMVAALAGELDPSADLIHDVEVGKISPEELFKMVEK